MNHMVDRELRVVRAQAYQYRMPLKRPYGTARGVTRGARNFVVLLHGDVGDETFTGVGECQPRHALTGDGPKSGDAAWTFLQAAVRHLHDGRLPVGDAAEAVTHIRQLMAQLDDIAREHADDTNRDRPFRGTMLGIEVALLDLASRALGLQISELLGKKRDDIAISISTVSTVDDVAAKVIKQKRFPMTRVKGVGRLEHDWELFETIAAANRSVGREKPIWMDINEALDLAGASTFVRGLVQRMAAGTLPNSIVLEGILPKAQVTELPQLQRLADDECRAVGAAEPLDLRIMPDEGMWDVSDLERVNAEGGCRALNIKAPKAGGLLASLDLANAAVAADPDIRVCIGGMLGTSDLTAWALHNLARALPRIDYLTTVPPTNVEQRISEPVARWRERGSNVIAAQTGPGLGTTLVPSQLDPYVERSVDTAPPAQTVTVAPVEPSGRVAGEPGGSVAGRTATLVFAGDTSLGDVHINAKGGKLLQRLTNEPMSYFTALRPLVSDRDVLIVNLETVLADSPVSPFEGKKRFLGWDLPSRTIQCLRDLGVDAVGLANNHTMDFGTNHLLDTRAQLEQAGIVAFGAGATLADAAAPHTITLGSAEEQRRIHVISAMEVQRKLRDEYGFYATADQPGVNPMSVRRISGQIEELKRTDPTALVVVYPHWGGNYVWVRESAQRASAAFSAAGADLIIGHGAHMLQQISIADHHATVYSLGNFVFNWSGRFSQYDVPPFGLVARVGVEPAADHWAIDVRLYPIASDNKTTGFTPRPATDNEFEGIVATLRDVDLDGSFTDRARYQTDPYGPHIAFSFTTGSGGPGSTRAAPASSTPNPIDAGRHTSPSQPTPESVRTIADRLDPSALDSYLLERAALARGLCCVRLSPTAFLAGVTPERAGELTFHHTMSTATPRVAYDLLTDKLHLKTILGEAGLPFDQHAEGDSLRMFVVGSSVVSTLRSTDEAPADVTAETHTDVLDVARRAVAAFPGLGHAEVRLALDDHRQPADAQKLCISDIDPVPRLAPHESGSTNDEGSVSAALVQLHLDEPTRARAPGDEVEVAATFTGFGSPADLRSALERVATERGVALRFSEHRDDRTLKATISGSLADVAAISVIIMSEPHAPETVEIVPAFKAAPERPEGSR
ncbi:CapA family protein [Phytoactinopolyspora limicola]|uniref:CapA family protein n=1 Tax=Phytoactinopolyspora limicola TaxID=2715536 RepID=UPI001407F9B7|nr:CapA family protein [Phytoactinopolyspora limicola]